MVNLRIGTYGNYYGSFTGESEILPIGQMSQNAKYIYIALTDKGWTKNSIFAMLGNIQAESSINPGRWQNDSVGNVSLGYGLVQWTPSTKYTNWCTERGYSDPSEMDNNLARILYEVENNLQWIATSTYNFSFKEFTTSTKSIDELAKAFLLCYERPADQSEAVQTYRSTLANNWANTLSGVVPDDPVNPSISKRKKKKFNFVLFNNGRRNQWIKTL